MKAIKKITQTEFIALMALITAIIPLAMDGMLPAFPMIEKEFQLPNPAQLQLTISILFLGFGFGQLIFGPLSEVFGRKSPIYWGIGIFIVGSVMSAVAPSYLVFLIGRFLQGFGGAGPRIISLALIRDEYEGDAMAKITSMVMTIFIFIPAVSPGLGQLILYLAGWREIFILLFAFGTLVLIWFALRQHETLAVADRRSFTLGTIVYGLRETFTKFTTLAGMIMSGLIFGIFVGYLGAVKNLFENVFQVYEQFSLIFAVLALSIGAASFFNARLVMRLGIRRLLSRALVAMVTLSILFIVYLIFWAGERPPLWAFMCYMIPIFFCVGFLFGNLNALAMTPLGHVAGMGSAFLGCVQSSMAVVVGQLIGFYFHTSVLPLAISFGAMGSVCLVILSLETRAYQNSLPRQ